MTKEEFVEVALQLVKDRAGISVSVRDQYITKIIEGVVEDMEEEKGIVIDYSSPAHLMFIVDWSNWMYSSRDSERTTPRHLQYRLHNMILHCGQGR